MQEEKEKTLNLLNKVISDKSANFLDFGAPLEKFGNRYVKFSDNQNEHGIEDTAFYFGEWCASTHRPHGRGLRVLRNGEMRFAFRDQVKNIPGQKYLTVCSDRVEVGVMMIERDGRRYFDRKIYKFNGIEETAKTYI